MMVACKCLLAGLGWEGRPSQVSGVAWYLQELLCVTILNASIMHAGWLSSVQAAVPENYISIKERLYGDSNSAWAESRLGNFLQKPPKQALKKKQMTYK